MKKVVVVPLVLMLSTTWSVHAVQRVRVSATPSQSFAPATVRVRVTLTPDPSNRALVVEVDGEGLFSSSEMLLNGAEAPRVLETRVPNLPVGDYVVTAIVFDNSGRAAAVAEQSVRVIR